MTQLNDDASSQRLAELQIYDVKPGTAAAFEARFSEALPARSALSPLGAFWNTEVGMLNRALVVWPYANEAERARVEAQEKALAGWPPKADDLVLSRETHIFKVAPFSPPIEPRELGRLYEIQTYTYPTAQLPDLINSWSEYIAERVKWSPLVGAWYLSSGEKTDWMHIWSYRDMAERDHLRTELARQGIWPISAIFRRLKQKAPAMPLVMQNMFVSPAAISPLR